MNKAEKFKKDLVGQESEKEKLIAQKNKWGQEFLDHEGKELELLKLLSSGDSKAEKALADLKQKKERCAELIRGQKARIADKDAEIDQLRQSIKKEEDEREQRWKLFLSEETSRDSQALLDSIENEYQEVHKYHLLLADKIGRICVVWGILERRRDSGERIVSQFLQDLPTRLRMDGERAGLRALDLPGLGGSVTIPAAILFPDPISKDFGENPHYTRAHSQYYEAKRIEKLRGEFELIEERG